MYGFCLVPSLSWINKFVPFDSSYFPVKSSYESSGTITSLNIPPPPSICLFALTVTTFSSISISSTEYVISSILIEPFVETIWPFSSCSTWYKTYVKSPNLNLPCSCWDDEYLAVAVKVSSSKPFSSTSIKDI